MRKAISTQVIKKDYDELVEGLKEEGISFAEWLKYQIKEFLKKRKEENEPSR